MPDRTDKLTKFWQELKRRKVFKVIAMYTGTAFIILEAVNNLVPITAARMDTDIKNRSAGNRIPVYSNIFLHI